MPRKDEYWRDPEKHRRATRAYAIANPDWKKASNAAWLKTPQGKAFSKEAHLKQRLGWTEEQVEARAAYQREWFAANPDYNKTKLLERRAKYPTRHMTQAAKVRAAKLGVPFDLDWQKIEIPEICPVLGMPLVPSRKGEPLRAAPSLDRLIPSLGYVQSNVRVISHEANLIKRSDSLEVLRDRADRLRKQLAGVEAVVAYLEREIA